MEIRIGEVKQPLQLAYPLVADVPCRMRGTRLVQKPLGFFLVRLCNVKGMFQGCLMLKCRVLFHDTSLCPFPG